MHLGSQFLLGPSLVLLNICKLPLLDLLEEIGSGGFVLVHELVPFLAEFLELVLLGLLSVYYLVVVEYPQVFVASFQLPLSDLLDLLL